MASFTEFQNILPDPDYGIGTAGQVGNSYGPGFTTVKLSSDRPIMRNRTNSGRTISRAQMYHKWSIDIAYNELTKEEFYPVYSFLLEKQGSLKPFFVSLPQYRTQVADISVAATISPGSTKITLVGGTPIVKPGFLFTVDDPLDSTHTKAYKVVRVENNADYLVADGRPLIDTQRITVSPNIVNSISSSADLIFTNPLIQVIQNTEVQEYSLGSTGLYNFSLKLEEVTY